jgi:xylan 1,4-beta-xylosidase
LADVVEHSVTAAPDINAVATRNGNEVDILLWNYHDADVPAPDVQVHLEIDGLHGKTADAAEYRVDATHGNAYRAWQQMGSPVHPTLDQVEQLQKAGALKQSVPSHSISLSAGMAAIELTLPRQAVVLVRLQER